MDLWMDEWMDGWMENGGGGREMRLVERDGGGRRRGKI